MSGRSDWSGVGSARRVRGERSEGFLALGSFPDGPLGSPVTIVCGAKPGPTLWVQACVHGTETGGIAGLNRFLAGLAPERLAGTIVAVLVANPLAFEAQSRNTPYDGDNLNRVFPGAAAGAHSRQVAHRLIEAAGACADAMVDLHSGGDRSQVPFYAISWNDGSPAGNAAREIAMAADVAHVWTATDTWLGGSMIAHMTRRGVPAIIVECGGAGRVGEEDVASFARALASIAAHLGMTSGRPVNRVEAVIDRCVLVYNERGGLFETSVAPAAIVAKGQAVGRIVSLQGKVVEVIRAPVGPAYIAALRKPWAAVASGEMLAECVEVVEWRGQ